MDSLDKYPNIVIKELHVHAQDPVPIQVAFFVSCLSILAMVAGVFWIFKNPLVGTLVCVIALFIFTLAGIFTLRQADKISEGSFLKVLNKVYSKIPGLSALLNLFAPRR